MKFENEIKPLRNKIYQNELQNKTLEQLRDTLLPKLMNGEIDLDKIESNKILREKLANAERRIAELEGEKRV